MISAGLSRLPAWPPCIFVPRRQSRVRAAADAAPADVLITVCHPSTWLRANHVTCAVNQLSEKKNKIPFHMTSPFWYVHLQLSHGPGNRARARPCSRSTPIPPHSAIGRPTRAPTEAYSSTGYAATIGHGTPVHVTITGGLHLQSTYILHSLHPPLLPQRNSKHVESTATITGSTRAAYGNGSVWRKTRLQMALR